MKTLDFAFLVKRHTLASSIVSRGFQATVECVQIDLGHCSLLEAQGLIL
jgi:hypothetical protein